MKTMANVKNIKCNTTLLKKEDYNVNYYSFHNIFHKTLTMLK